MKKSKALALILSICMLFSIAAPAMAVDADFSSPSDARAAIVNYYQDNVSQLTNWEELVALKAAGADLAAFALPDTTDINGSSSAAQYAGAIISEVMKGYDPTQLVAGLLAKQNPAGSGRFSALCNEQIWAMIALDAAEASYDGVEATKYLLSMAQGHPQYAITDAQGIITGYEAFGFDYTGSSPAYIDVDTTGAAAVAMSRYLSDPAFSTEAYQTLLGKIIALFSREQQSDGSFASWGTENASSTASAIWGLCALGENISSDADYIKNSNTISDGLLSFVSEDSSDGTRGYVCGYDWSSYPPVSSGQFDAFYTRQALIALSDIVNGGTSTYKNLSQYKGEYQYRTVEVLAASLSANLVNQRLTAKSPQNQPLTAKEALEQAFDAAGSISFSGDEVTQAGGVSSADGEEWLLFVNGERQDTSYRLVDSDRLELLLTKMAEGSRYAYFDQISVTNKQMGEDISLALTGKNLSNGTEQPVSGAAVLVNGAPYTGYPSTTNASGQITLNFLQSGTYEISASVSEDTITRPYCKIVIPSGSGYSKTISIRVEGISSNVIYETAFTASTPADKLLTVSDALVQALDANGKAYGEAGGYFSSINGDTASAFDGWDGWLYVVNGADPGVGMGTYVLAGGEDIVVYYGDYGTTLYPKVASQRQGDGSFKITFTADSTDPVTWMPTEVAIAGATVLWDGSQLPALTDSNGSVVVAQADSGAGHHTLQLFKNGAEKEGRYLPCVVRLPCDYRVTIANEITAPTGDAGEVDLAALTSADPPQAIEVPLGATNSTVKVSEDTPLPEIAVTNSALSLLIPQNTRVTSSDAGWNGEIALPQIQNNVTISGKTIDKTISVGSADRTLTFDQPVRLLIPNGAGKTVAYLDASNNPVVIDTPVSSDNMTAAAASLTAAGKTEGRIDVGLDTAVWTTHFTTFVSYTTPAPAPANTVTVAVTGYGGQANFSFSTVTLQAGDTPLSVLQRKASAESFTVVVTGGYVSSIGGLAEFDLGVSSGWMYKVNGSAPSVGAGSYSLSAGDVVAWMYTTNLGTDIGADYSPVLTTQLTATQLSDIQKSISDVAARIAAKAQISDFELMLLALDGKGSDISAYKEALKDEIATAGGVYRKYTDLSRTILAARAAGLNPANMGGVNLVSLLSNFENVEMQGVNGPVFALLSYDAIGLKLPKDLKNSREALKSAILSYQNENGGFSLSKGGSSDVDLTAMALSSLAPYQSETAIRESVGKALTYLSVAQRTDGGFAASGVPNCESVAQVIIALTSLGIDPMDVRFVKGEVGLLDNLLSFRNADGGFCHTVGGGTDAIATEQAGLALLAYRNFNDGKPSLYDMTKNSLPQYDDSSQVASWAAASVLSCQKNGIMEGDGQGNFLPKNSLTRAEASKILVNLMQIGYNEENEGAFPDVASDRWYAPFVAAAAKAGLVKGIEGGGFNPSGNISRQDFAVLLARALKLEADVGFETDDFDKISPYAKEAVSAVCSEGLMVGTDAGFDPKGSVTREMIAVVIGRIYANIFE